MEIVTMEAKTEQLQAVYGDDEAAYIENIERIRRYSVGDKFYLSTSQAIMVGLALCRPDLLAAENYRPSDMRAAWARLNDGQREAVITWWR